MTTGARTTLMAALALLAAGCAGGAPLSAPADPPVAVAAYACADGTSLRVAWWKNRAEVDGPARHWTLPRALSGSGARYGDGAREIWEHQGTLRVTGPAGTTTCRRGDR